MTRENFLRYMTRVTYVLISQNSLHVRALLICISISHSSGLHRLWRIIWNEADATGDPNANIHDSNCVEIEDLKKKKKIVSFESEK